MQLTVRRTPYHGCNITVDVRSDGLVLTGVQPRQGSVPNCGDLIEHQVVFSSKRAIRRSVLRRMRESATDLLSRAVPYPSAVKRARDRLKAGAGVLKGKFVLSELVLYCDRGTDECVLSKDEWTWVLDPQEFV